MSVPTTNYVIYNPNTLEYQDLSGVFLPYTSGTKASATGYLVNGNDLCNIFAPRINLPIGYNTNLRVQNSDLSTIFEPLNPITLFTTQNVSNCTVGSGYLGGYYYITCRSSSNQSQGSVTLTFNVNISNASIVCVGGGGKGGNGGTSLAGSGGAGGGNYILVGQSLTQGSSYDVLAGWSGRNVTDQINGGTSRITNVTNSTIILECTGGERGRGVDSSVGGIGGVVTIINGSPAPSNTGKGGNSSSQDSDSFITPWPVPAALGSGTAANIRTSYSGSGGEGGQRPSGGSANGGTPAFYGDGGITGGSTFPGGLPANVSSHGSGGGGGGEVFSGTTSGGSGATGFVAIFFAYP